MIKVFIGPRHRFSHIPLLYPYWGICCKKTQLFYKSIWLNQKPVIKLEPNPRKADYVLLPHDYYYVKSDHQYLYQYQQLSDKYKKKIIVLYHSDFNDYISLKNSIVFRTSQYKSKLKPNEIIMPAYCQDLSKHYSKIKKKPKKPTIGFCGWANYSSIRQQTAFIIRDLFTPQQAKKPGIIWRRRCLNILSKNTNIITSFIIRNSFSANLNTISLSPTKARKDYVQNMKKSDLVLCIKGSGNYSLRFFESLSMGHIPLFMDTDTPLPLSNIIPYQDFILNISHNDIENINNIINSWWATVTLPKLQSMQIKARSYYQKYLNINSFFKYIFSANHLKEQLKSQR